MKINKFGKMILLIFAFITLCAAATAIVLFENKYADRYYPGVTIGGESVGGKTYEEVFGSFKAKAELITDKGLTLVFRHNEQRSKEVLIPVLSSGFTSDALVEYFSLGDWEKTLEDGYSFGRQGSFTKRLKEQFFSVLGRNFDFSLALPYEEAVRSLLARETKNFIIPAAPAQFVFSGGKVSIVPEKIGDDINSEKVISIISEKLKTLQVDPIVFDIQTAVPFVTEERLKANLGLVEELANSANITFYYQSRKWKVGGQTLITWLTLSPDEDLKINENKLKSYLAKSVVPFINNPPRNSRFEMREGKLVETAVGKSGNVVDIEKTIERIGKIIPTAKKSFDMTGSIFMALNDIGSDIKLDAENKIIDVLIETKVVEPTVTKETVNQYGIDDLVGSARTNFAGGSKDRQRNIEVGASKLTGILIAPGEEFSLVKALGEITEAEGFVKEFVIKENQTVKELGGGLCQLATTLFRAALNAGFPITERKNHRYVISYYGPGLDATIYGPHPDLRFMNDTGNYLLLQSKTKNNEAIFEFYGVADGRVAEVSKPELSNEKPVPAVRNIASLDVPRGEKKCTTFTHKGVTANVVYKIQYSDGNTREQTFRSVYQPWPIVCLIGPT